MVTWQVETRDIKTRDIGPPLFACTRQTFACTGQTFRLVPRGALAEKRDRPSDRGRAGSDAYNNTLPSGRRHANAHPQHHIAQDPLPGKEKQLVRCMGSFARLCVEAPGAQLPHLHSTRHGHRGAAGAKAACNDTRQPMQQCVPQPHNGWIAAASSAASSRWQTPASCAGYASRLRWELPSSRL